MELEWDEAKRATNLARHDLDFIDARDMFDGRPMFVYPSPRGEETRFVSVGLIERKFYAVVWTFRGEARRLISFRRARDGENREYRARYS